MNINFVDAGGAVNKVSDTSGSFNVANIVGTGDFYIAIALILIVVSLCTCGYIFIRHQQTSKHKFKNSICLKLLTAIVPIVFIVPLCVVGFGFAGNTEVSAPENINVYVDPTGNVVTDDACIKLNNYDHIKYDGISVNYKEGIAPPNCIWQFDLDDQRIYNGTAPGYKPLDLTFDEQVTLYINILNLSADQARSLIGKSVLEITLELYPQKAEIETLPVARDDIFYNDGQELVAPGTSNLGEIVYALGDELGPSTKYSLEVPQSTNVPTGTTCVWYKAIADPGYKDSDEDYVMVDIQKIDSYWNTNPSCVDSFKYKNQKTKLIYNNGSTECGTIFYTVTNIDMQPDPASIEIDWSNLPSDVVGQTCDDYYIWAYIKGDNNHSDSSVYKVGVVTISPAESSYLAVPQINDHLTFNDLLQDLITSPALTDCGTVSYCLSNASKDTAPTDGWNSDWTRIQAKNAAVYKIWYKIEADKNHLDTEASSVINKIEKADSYFTDVPLLSKEQVVYDNQSHKCLSDSGSTDCGQIMFLVNQNNVAPEYSDLDWKDNPDSITAKQVGKYYVWCYIKANINHNDGQIICVENSYFEISLASAFFKEGLFPVTIDVDLTYDTTSQSLLSFKGDTDCGTINYCVTNTNDMPEKDDEHWTTDAEKVCATDAGNYFLWTYIQGDAVSYSDSDITLISNNPTVILQAQSLFIENPEVVAGNIMHDGNDHMLISSPGSVNGGSIYYSVDRSSSLNDEKSWDQNYQNIKGKDLGVYTVYAKIVGNINYKNLDEVVIASVEIVDKVTASFIEKPEIPSAQIVFDNTAKSLLSSSGTANGGAIMYAVSESDVAPSKTDAEVWFDNYQNATKINARTYYLWAYIKENDTYAESSVLAIGTKEIEKATREISLLSGYTNNVYLNLDCITSVTQQYSISTSLGASNSYQVSYDQNIIEAQNDFGACTVTLTAKASGYNTYTLTLHDVNSNYDNCSLKINVSIDIFTFARSIDPETSEPVACIDKYVGNNILETYNISNTVKLPSIDNSAELVNYKINCIGDGTAPIFSSDKFIKNLSVGDNVKKINSGAFLQTGIEAVDLKNVESIEMFAFAQSSIQTVISYKVKSIGLYAFAACANFSTFNNFNSLTLPDCIQDLGAYAFKDCSNSNLNSILLNNCINLTTLDNGIFKGCSNVSSLKISNSLTRISSDCFSGTSIPYDSNYYNLQMDNDHKAILDGSQFSNTSKDININSLDISKDSKLANVRIFADNCFENYDKNLQVAINLTQSDSTVYVGSLSFNDCLKLSLFFTGDSRVNYFDGQIFGDAGALINNSRDDKFIVAGNLTGDNINVCDKHFSTGTIKLQQKKYTSGGSINLNQNYLWFDSNANTHSINCSSYCVIDLMGHVVGLDNASDDELSLTNISDNCTLKVFSSKCDDALVATLKGGSQHIDGLGFAKTNNSCKIILSSIYIDSWDNDEAGGFLYLKGTTNVILNNCQVRNCNSDSDGGVFYLKGKSKLYSIGSKFTNNKSDNSGGVFYGEESANFEFVDSYFDKNSAKDDGGAICFLGNSRDLSLSNTLFTNNTAEYNGGAVSIERKSSYSTQDCLLSIYNNCSFLANTAEVCGGAIHCTSMFSIKDSVFNYNTADGASFYRSEGGAIYLNPSQPDYKVMSAFVYTIEDTEFIQNQSDYGGAISANDIFHMDIVGKKFVDRKYGTTFRKECKTCFKNNKALSGSGGAINCKCHKTTSVYANNKGLNIYGPSDSDDKTKYILFESNSSYYTMANSGGAIYYDPHYILENDCVISCVYFNNNDCSSGIGSSGAAVFINSCDGKSTKFSNCWFEGNSIDTKVVTGSAVACPKNHTKFVNCYGQV